MENLFSLLNIVATNLFELDYLAQVTASKVECQTFEKNSLKLKLVIHVAIVTV